MFYLQDLSGLGCSQRSESITSISYYMYVSDGAISYSNLARNGCMIVEI